MDIAGRKVVVFGAERACASATASSLLAAGATVVSISRDSGQAKTPAGAAGFRVDDPSNEEAMISVFAEIEREHGPVDAVIACPTRDTIIDLDAEDAPDRFAAAIEDGALDFINTARLAASSMIKGKPADRVVISLSPKCADHAPDPAASAVAAARAAMMPPAASEFEDRGIRFVGIEFVEHEALLDDVANLVRAALVNPGLNGITLSLRGAVQ